MSISSLWPATAIKAFVTDKLGAPPSVLRTPDVFADAVLGIAEEKSDKWVWQFCSLDFFFWLKVVNRKTESLLGKTTFVIVYCVFRQSIFWCSKHVKIPLFFRLNGLALIDEDYLRTTGISDFSKYRCDPDVEPPRMMPRKFPDLSVEEENEKVFPKL